MSFLRVLPRRETLSFRSIGENRICFNAHRAYAQTIMAYFEGLKLTEFSVVDDEGQFHEKIDYRKFSDLHYGCGLFEFSK